MSQSTLYTTQARIDESAASAGLIPGVTAVRKFGFNPVASATYQPIWTPGTAYTFPNEALAIRIRAGGDAQDGPGGTGARLVQVEGLDSNGAEVPVLLTTQGTSVSSNSSESLWRINRAYLPTVVGAVGSLQHNAAAISIENTAGELLAQIPSPDPEGGQTEQSIYTVEAGHEFILRAAQVTTDGNGVDVVLLQRQHLTVSGDAMPTRTVDRFEAVTAVTRVYGSGVRFPALTDIYAVGRREGGGSNSRLQFNFSGWLRRVSG